MNPILQLALRHTLTALGGALVTYGYLNSTELEALVGALVTIIGLVLSYLEKRKRA
jgi:hypothetical protein